MFKIENCVKHGNNTICGYGRYYLVVDSNFNWYIDVANIENDVDNKPSGKCTSLAECFEQANALLNEF